MLRNSVKSQNLRNAISFPKPFVLQNDVILCSQQNLSKKVIKRNIRFAGSLHFVYILLMNVSITYC